MPYIIDSTNPLEYFEVQDQFLFGQDTDCNMKVNDLVAEPRHARVEQKETGFLLRDLRSASGTFLNGSRIQESWVEDGDEIRIGDKTYFFYREKIEDSGIGLKSKNSAWNMQLERLGNVAKTDFPILLLGPSGTGKEILAQALHQHSKRSQGPFVSVNCSALTETLVESELFGHVKGSFTGAISDRKGAFEMARGGTLFLDEIGDLTYGLQAKLLRALENDEIRPVGSDKNLKTDVRIIAATHQNLTEKIYSAQFRSDLYFRLNVITVNPPALKDRMEDFEDLLAVFAKKMRVRFSFGAIQKLRMHTWPGNIRELKNTVARASALFPKRTLEIGHMDDILDRINFSFHQDGKTSIPTPTTPLPVLKELEKQMIIKRLVANGGNQRRTAADLGMPKSTLHDRLKLYQINPKSYQPRPNLNHPMA